MLDGVASDPNVQIVQRSSDLSLGPQSFVIRIVKPRPRLFIYYLHKTYQPIFLHSVMLESSSISVKSGWRPNSTTQNEKNKHWLTGLAYPAPKMQCRWCILRRRRYRRSFTTILYEVGDALRQYNVDADSGAFWTENTTLTLSLHEFHACRANSSQPSTLVPISEELETITVMIVLTISAFIFLLIIPMPKWGKAIMIGWQPSYNI